MCALLLIGAVKVCSPAGLVMIKAVWSTTACLVGFDTQGSGCIPYTSEPPILSPIFFKLVGIKQGMQVSVEHQKATALPRGEEKKKITFFSRSFQEKTKAAALFYKTHLNNLTLNYSCQF